MAKKLKKWAEGCISEEENEMEKGRNNDIELNEEKTKKTKENTNRIGQYKGIIQKEQEE